MAKGDRAGRLVRTHGVKRKHDLAASLHPAAMLGHAVFAKVKRVENGCAIRSQVEGEDPFRRIRRRRVTLISTSKISLLPPGEADSSGPGRALQLCSGASGWNEPAKRQQETRKLWTDAYESGSSGVHDE
jgi:hypothetical protein